LGVTANDVAKSVVAGTSSSRYTSANYWPDPKSGIGYQVQVEIPEHQMNSLEEVKNLPIARRSGGQIDLRNVAGVTNGTTLGEYDTGAPDPHHFRRRLHVDVVERVDRGRFRIIPLRPMHMAIHVWIPVPKSASSERGKSTGVAISFRT
jgi:hypothetical protein